MEQIISGQFYNTQYEFNIQEKKLILNHNGAEVCCELLDTRNDNLIQAYKEEKVYLDTKEQELFQNKTIYYCSRSVLKTISCDTELYMDMLVYNDEKNVIYPNALNRSQGHCNKRMQIEYHQVMKGEIISIAISPEGKSYYGFFGEGDYIHVPKGWFHCTYVTKGPAVVGNFYCNTPWGDHVEFKPYFEIDNDYCIEYGDNDGEYILKKKGWERKVVIKRDEVYSLQELELYTYKDLEQDRIVRTEYPCKNIFDYFYQIDISQE